MENINGKNMALWDETAGNGPRPEAKNYLAFEPRKWQLDPSVEGNNVAERVVVTDMAGGLTEAFMLGDWQWHWSQIESPRMVLEKDTDYVFAFWLNGGENDGNNETCRLCIHFKDDEDNPVIFRLNRHYIKPVKYNGGWYRYEIPFNSGGAKGEDVIVQLRFAAMRAYCAVMPDKPEFADLPDEERPDSRIPQRHNIIFSDGYPRDSHWSHLVFGEGASYSPGNHGGMDWGAAPPNHQQTLDALVAMGCSLEDLLSDLPPDYKTEIIKGLFGVK